MKRQRNLFSLRYSKTNLSKLVYSGDSDDGDNDDDYLARARSARARRACALRALGLLLADGVLTVGWGKTFWRVRRVLTRKQP